MVTNSTPWINGHLVAVDLEGSGAQDRDDEAILEIAVVPLAAGRPDPAASYSTLVNPGRRIRRGPWISPGLSNKVLATAPALADVEPVLAELLDGAMIVGHNVGVDWRLLHRRCPSVEPAGLIDTLRIARSVRPNDRGRSLTALIDQLGLAGQVDQLASASQPHRALWDAVAAGLLLGALVGTDLSIGRLRALGDLPLRSETEAPRLFD